MQLRSKLSFVHKESNLVRGAAAAAMAMSAVPEADQWLPHTLTFAILFAACASSLIAIPYFSSPPNAPLDAGPTTASRRFRRAFFLLYSLASVIEGMESALGQHEYANYGISREQIAVYLSAGAAAALFLGSISGIVSDIIGPRRVCLLFCIIHLFLGVLKIMSRHPSIWITNICLGLSSSVFSFCFETWMVNEHEKQGHRQDLLNETFWLMTFFESASLIGSQGLANTLVKNQNKGFVSPFALVALLATISILYISKARKVDLQKSSVENYRKSFAGHILKDKRVWLLAWAQTSVYFSISVFWLIWAPTIMADGRAVNLSLVYPLFLGSRMLGSTTFPWLFGRAIPLYTEDCLIYAFIVACLSLLIVAYDYQEIGILVILFCIFHACVGFILPSLARLRTIFVPNELRGGMMSLSLAPANAAIWFILIQGSYYHNIENSVIFVLSALGLLSAAGCIHVLRWWRKQPRQNWHKN